MWEMAYQIYGAAIEIPGIYETMADIIYGKADLTKSLDNPTDDILSRACYTMSLAFWKTGRSNNPLRYYPS